MARAIHTVAAEIRREWGSKVNYAAKPYLDAMMSVAKPEDQYGLDSAKSIVLHFLSNAGTFRGGNAKALKQELKSICGIK